MSQPTQYTPTTDFSQQEANNASGRSTVNTAALDAEFANVEITLDQLCANLNTIQRDDGNLKDELVTVPSLDRNVLNLIGGFTVRGDWVTGTAYAVKDIVASAGYLYTCITAHTASALFSTDSAKWKMFGFKPSDGIAAAAAQATIDAHIADNDAAHASTAVSHGGGTVSSAITALESGKANLASPAFTGTPTCPTVSGGDSSSKLANTAFVANAIASILTGGATLASLGAIYNSSSAKSSAYTIVNGDKGKILVCSGTFTLSITAAATLGDGFAFGIVNNGAGVITIDPNSSETVNGSTTYPVNPTETVLVFCDGTKFILFGKAPASLVTSVNSLTGAITAGQIAAAATAGYGYTPANPSGLVSSDSNLGVGCFALFRPNGSIASVAAGDTASGTALNQCTVGDSGLISASAIGYGTWRNLSGATVHIGSGAGIFQRIA